ncbi:MAG: LysM peptidoglycan-binding domain-containing protein [Candidatus Melainabacteria bacterium]|nr:LysM peptidoglycan-binding domain-containing protein [Candidatus Melainabacteria bacterium]
MSTDNGAWRNCEKDSSQENSAACNFRPDYELSTARAQAWAQASDAQRATPLDLNQNGEYKVKFGDSLSTIAERALKGYGEPVNRDSLKAMQDAIVEANHDRYKTLDCNRDFIKENWCLKIPGARNEEPPARVEPPVTYEPPVRYEPPIRVEPIPEPDYRRPLPPRDCPPGMPQINNYEGGVVNIFMGDFGRPRQNDWGRERDWGRDRDYYQWNDMPRGCNPRQPMAYRPDYYHEPYRPEPGGCSPCERRQYHHNQRMPQVLRRNPSYPR